MAEIYDMLKARHSVSLKPFILSNKLSELYQLCLEVPSARYELCRTKAHYDKHRLRSSKYNFLSLWYNTNSNSSLPHADLGVLLLS